MRPGELIYWQEQRARADRLEAELDRQHAIEVDLLLRLKNAEAETYAVLEVCKELYRQKRALGNRIVHLRAVIIAICDYEGTYFPDCGVDVEAALEAPWPV